MTHAELENAYLALCDTVVSGTRRIAGLSGAGRSEAAGCAAVDLMDIAVDAKQAYLMQQERALTYDLAALHVYADTPSNSETGWEKED